ncbi:MAG: porin family protein [Bacteroidaceae bacterium]|nr:porin family protein [Bacteroidaceae bacterium]
MKKLTFTLLFALMGISSAFAQFEKGKYYLSATTNSGDLSYSKHEKFHFDLGVNGGYMFEDGWMALAEAGFDYHNSDMQTFYVGAKCRYLIEQNGLFLQAGVRFLHGAPSFNDVQITPELGYCFFLNKHLTFEPSLYYDVSLSDFSEKSKCGIKFGLAWLF